MQVTGIDSGPKIFSDRQYAEAVKQNNSECKNEGVGANPVGNLHQQLWKIHLTMFWSSNSKQLSTPKRRSS